MNEYQQKIESLLFVKNQPLSYVWISRYLGISVANTKEEIEEMKTYYTNRGIDIATTPDEVSLVTAHQQREHISELLKEDESKELSKQAMETLAIIVYKGRVTKSEIDFIRGVNAMYILRNLLIRGLIIKKQNPEDKRSPWYQPSLDLLAYLGVNSISELEGYNDVTQQLKDIALQFNEEQQDEE